MARRTREQIKSYLIGRDRVLRPLITRLPYPVARRNHDIYASLIHAVIAQQLSVRAANTIQARAMALFPDDYPQPELVRRMPVPRLRAAGLSRRKIEYLKAIAGFALEEDLSYARLAARSDEEMIDYLTQIHGVGRWTVEMLLMFSFQRPDVFSVDDVGLQNALQKLYGLDDTGRALKQRMLVIAENWRPYRAIVCKYLWRWKAQADANN